MKEKIDLNDTLSVKMIGQLVSDKLKEDFAVNEQTDSFCMGKREFSRFSKKAKLWSFE